jgi:hypothetical protein
MIQDKSRINNPARSSPLLPPVADVMRQHHKVAVRVLHEDLYLTRLTITCFAPNLSGSEIDRPIHRNELGEKRVDLSKVNLEHRALPKWMLH